MISMSMIGGTTKTTASLSACKNPCFWHCYFVEKTIAKNVIPIYTVLLSKYLSVGDLYFTNLETL